MAKEDKAEFEETEDESVYGEDAREDLVDGDALSSEEEAFMKGYDDADVEEKEETEENIEEKEEME